MENTSDFATAYHQHPACDMLPGGGLWAKLEDFMFVDPCVLAAHVGQKSNMNLFTLLEAIQILFS